MELKPCPFCGGNAEARDYLDEDDNDFYYVVCLNCGSRTNGYPLDNGIPERAAAAWNRRVNYGWLVPQMCTADDLKTDLPLPRTYSTKGSDSDA